MSNFKVFLLSLTGLIVVLLLGFGLTYYNYGMFKFFAPKMEDARREVFENTKSYTHGMIQDLAKYYKEYQQEDEQGKEIIANVIRTTFADFDANKIKNHQLKNFLINIRGY